MTRYALVPFLMIAALTAFISCSSSAGSGEEDPEVNVAFLSAAQDAGASYTADTTALTLTFDVDPTTLTADNLVVTGARKGSLSGTGLTRTLAISDITVANGGTVSVNVSSPAGFAVSNAPQTATVYREIAVGRAYLGGTIGYILQTGDAGYDASVPHGLILSNEDLDTYCRWAVTACYDARIGTTGMAIGTGRANTEAIVAQNGIGNYSAYITSVYEGGGFTDWYLPSARELEAIRRNIVLVPSCYHSSSEYDASNTYVVWNDFAVLGEGKYGGRYVRAVRDF